MKSVIGLVVFLLSVLTLQASCKENNAKLKIDSKSSANISNITLEVSDENCRKKFIEKLSVELQQSQSSKCLRRASFKPSKPKEW